MLDLKTGGRSCRWIDSETGTTMNAVSSANPRCTSWCMSRKAPSHALSTLAVSRWQRLGTPGALTKPKHWRSVTRRRLAAGGHTHISRASVHHRSPLTAYLTAKVRDGDESLRSKTIHQRGASPPF